MSLTQTSNANNAAIRQMEERNLDFIPDDRINISLRAKPMHPFRNPPTTQRRGAHHTVWDLSVRGCGLSACAAACFGGAAFDEFPCFTEGFSDTGVAFFFSSPSVFSTFLPRFRLSLFFLCGFPSTLGASAPSVLVASLAVPVSLCFPSPLAPALSLRLFLLFFLFPFRPPRPAVSVSTASLFSVSFASTFLPFRPLPRLLPRPSPRPLSPPRRPPRRPPLPPPLPPRRPFRPIPNSVFSSSSRTFIFRR
mmetsp:Transcript_26791/g.50041  ORF Transcript_26791/g.50041 Transcript_26791/m.50041 type:complete len:250 (-) Transcript_26791:236-985(-)